MPNNSKGNICLFHSLDVWKLGAQLENSHPKFFWVMIERNKQLQINLACPRLGWAKLFFGGLFLSVINKNQLWQP